MKIYLRPLALAALVFALASPAQAGDLKLSMQNGRVTLIAHDVPLRQILQEWARVGNTQIVNGDKVPGAPLTLELVDVPEAQALDTLLRSAAGYMAAPRAVASSGTSVYDRIMILATSHPPAATAVAAPQPFMPRPQPQPVDDDDEPVSAPIAMPMPNPGQTPPFPPAQQPGMQQPGVQQPVTQQPGVQQPVTQPQPGQQTPVTAPRPGALPVPQNPNGGIPNPYQPYQPSVVRPVGPGGPGGPEGGN
jgi:hypothetical protein